LLRKFDTQSLPTILRLTLEGGLDKYHFEHDGIIGPPKEIGWEKDWRDINPIFIDYVEVWPKKVVMSTSGEFPRRLYGRGLLWCLRSNF
jgi:hypothetical protein